MRYNTFTKVVKTEKAKITKGLQECKANLNKYSCIKYRNALSGTAF